MQRYIWDILGVLILTIGLLTLLAFMDLTNGTVITWWAELLQRWFGMGSYLFIPIAFGVGIVVEKEIDEINILNASFLAMHRALSQLKIRPGHLIIDGNRFKAYQDILHSCIVKGDGKYASIAAASILAKTCRDEFMHGLHQEYPVYGWESNKGYPTRSHRKAILEYGPSPYHRRSFRLLNDQMELDFS